MSRETTRQTRREFIKSSALVAGAVAVGSSATAQEPKLPMRVLGRTGIEISLLSLGLGAAGDGRVDPDVVREIVNLCIDEGVTYIDDAPIYGNTQATIGPVLTQRRSDVTVASKVEAQDRAGALKQLEQSRRDLQCDVIDVAFIHNVPDFDTEQMMGPEGAFTALREAREAGHVRFLGLSGHNRPGRFISTIETGEVDVVMMPMNFVDRHTYNFENTVLPAAAKQNCGVLCMKVLGGVPNWNYRNIGHANLAAHYTDAIRYAVTLPGVASAVMGLCTPDEARQAIATIKSAEPLDDAELATLLAKGKGLVDGLGYHYGPAV